MASLTSVENMTTEGYPVLTQGLPEGPSVVFPFSLIEQGQFSPFLYGLAGASHFMGNRPRSQSVALFYGALSILPGSSLYANRQVQIQEMMYSEDGTANGGNEDLDMAWAETWRQTKIVLESLVVVMGENFVNDARA